MIYTVKQLADLAGVSTRTLHYYDEIRLLSPSALGQNGYRYYNEQALLRLQQIMFFRELDFSLAEIQRVIDGPDFEIITSLQQHRLALQQRQNRLDNLIQTIDQTVAHLKGTQQVEPKQLFAGFDETQQPRYEQEIASKYGDKELKESRRRWGSYTPAQKEQVKAAGKAVYRDLLAYVNDDPTSAEVQQIISRWHEHLRYFYEPTRQIMLGLAQTYVENPEFAAVYQQMHPNMPEFLRAAITCYCQNLPPYATK